MDNLQITAWMASPLATYDDWSPSIDSLIEYQLLDRLGLLTPNPSDDDVANNLEIVMRNMPLDRPEIKGEWYWAASSPHYYLESEQTQRFRKRWDYQDHHLQWGKKKAKVDNSQGHFKSYDLPRYDRETKRIDWFCRGDDAELLSLLSSITNIGKKRSQGCGQVYKWEINKFESDWHLWRGECLARPMPLNLINQPPQINIMKWGWRPPVWLESNRQVCYMPTQNVWR